MNIYRLWAAMHEVIMIRTRIEARAVSHAASTEDLAPVYLVSTDYCEDGQTGKQSRSTQATHTCTA